MSDQKDNKKDSRDRKFFEMTDNTGAKYQLYPPSDSASVDILSCSVSVISQEHEESKSSLDSHSILGIEERETTKEPLPIINTPLIPFCEACGKLGQFRCIQPGCEMTFWSGNCRQSHAFAVHIDILQSGQEVQQVDLKNGCETNIKLQSAEEFMEEKANETIVTCRQQLDAYQKLLLSKNLTVRFSQQYQFMKTFGTTNGCCLFLPGSKHVNLRHYLSLFFEEQWVLWVIVSPSLRYVVNDDSLDRLLEVVDTINNLMWIGSFYIEEIPSTYLQSQNCYEVAVCFKHGFHCDNRNFGEAQNTLIWATMSKSDNQYKDSAEKFLELAKSKDIEQSLNYDWQVEQQEVKTIIKAISFENRDDCLKRCSRKIDRHIRLNKAYEYSGLRSFSTGKEQNFWYMTRVANTPSASQGYTYPVQVHVGDLMYITFFITNTYKNDPSVYTFAPHNSYEFNYREEMILKRYLRRLLNYINLRLKIGKWHFDAWRRHILYRVHIPYQILMKGSWVDQYEANLEAGARSYEVYSLIICELLQAFENGRNRQEIDEKMKQLYAKVQKCALEYQEYIPKGTKSQERIESTASTSQSDPPRSLSDFLESKAKQADQLKSIVPSVLSRAYYDKDKEDIDAQASEFLQNVKFTENQLINPVKQSRPQVYDRALFKQISYAMIDSLCNKDYEQTFQEVNIWHSDEIRVNFHGANQAETIQKIREHVGKLLPDQKVDIDPIDCWVKVGVAKFQKMRQFTHHSVIKFLFLLKNEYDNKHYIIKEKPRISLFDHVKEQQATLTQIQLWDYFGQINNIVDAIRRDSEGMPHLNINVKNVYIDREQIKLSEPFCCQVSLDADHQHPGLNLENTDYKTLQAYEVWGMMQIAVFLLSADKSDHVAAIQDFAPNDRLAYSRNPIMFIPEDLQDMGRKQKSQDSRPIEYYLRKLVECLHRGGKELGEVYRRQLQYYMLKIKNEREIENNMGNLDFLL